MMGGPPYIDEAPTKTMDEKPWVKTKPWEKTMRCPQTMG
jgi:hypothetical protein